MALSPDILGRRFNGAGDPIDGFPAVIPEPWGGIIGSPINPVARDNPSFFLDEFDRSGVSEHTVVYLNLADDPTIERLLTPRFALTAAEYLAFTHHRHVLVILTDMTNYCDALRERSAE